MMEQTIKSNKEQAHQHSKEQSFIHLSQRAIEAQKPAELKFIMVNQTNRLVPFEQGLYFDVAPNGKAKLSTASGLMSTEKNAPFTVWVNRLIKTIGMPDDVTVMSINDAPSDLIEDWDEWLPNETLWVPLTDFDGHCIGLMVYARQAVWTETEQKQMALVHKTYSHALTSLLNKKKSLPARILAALKPKTALIALLIIIGLMFIPVRLSALAPAEIIAMNALSIAAPQDGVIQSFFVEPNEPVKKGDLLFTLDNTVVTNRYKVAAKALAIAKADALVAKQRAFNDPEGKAMLANAIGRVKEKRAELASVQSLMTRVEVRAEHDGIAIFSDKNDWIGRPVQTGERVIQLADPADAGLLVWLPVKDALTLEKGAPMKMFLHTDPMHPVEASLEQTSYQSSLSPDNVASYRLKGAFETTETLPRIGLGGTARISGDWSILGYYLFRRPIAAVREWTGV